MVIFKITLFIEMKTKLLNRSLPWEHLNFFTCFSEENDLLQEPDETGMVRI